MSSRKRIFPMQLTHMQRVRGSHKGCLIHGGTKYQISTVRAEKTSCERNAVAKFRNEMQKFIA